ncbi:hypothetical protein F4695_002488 [Rhizobium soli]|uniref:Uncharacterized protein n=1 Tax=Rhizobium soli TaxID=424798 RepID=A0A7X0MS96_9HYPH|nr:hypothetical protein [Rhizobium soli]
MSGVKRENADMISGSGSKSPHTIGGFERRARADKAADGAHEAKLCACRRSGLVARFERKPDDVMQKFRIDQHVEGDRHLLLFAAHHGAADFVMNAEDFQEEIGRDRQAGADLQFGAIKRDGPDQAAEGGIGREMVSDKDDPAGPVYRKLFKCPIARMSMVVCGILHHRTRQIASLVLVLDYDFIPLFMNHSETDE